jgi:hypothetical protein
VFTVAEQFSRVLPLIEPRSDSAVAMPPQLWIE